jgi:hypothetical protein
VDELTRELASSRAMSWAVSVWSLGLGFWASPLATRL